METTTGKLVNIALCLMFGCIFVGRSGWKRVGETLLSHSTQPLASHSYKHENLIELIPGHKRSPFVSVIDICSLEIIDYILSREQQTE